jgi:hypothetical protein
VQPGGREKERKDAGERGDWGDFIGAEMRRNRWGINRIEEEEFPPGAAISSGDCGWRLKTPDRWGPLSARGRRNAYRFKEGREMGRRLYPGLGSFVSPDPFSVFSFFFPFSFLFSFLFCNFYNFCICASN